VCDAEVPDGQTFLATLRDRAWFGPLARVPRASFRLGLGRIVGRRFAILTTTGRISGQPRHTMTFWHEADAGRAEAFYVLALYGPRSQWYRNTLANPVITAQTAAGARPFHATRITDHQELLDAVGSLRRTPLLWRPYLAAQGVPDDAGELLAHRDRIIVVRLDPVGGPGPPTTSADLVWVWPVAALVIAAGWSLGRR
jgi:deazaflavin-dependent oxidoreductase (nitroreductase family)